MDPNPPTIRLNNGLSRRAAGPGTSQATLWVCSHHPDDEYYQISLDPGCSYKIDFRPSNTAGGNSVTMFGSKVEAALTNQSLTPEQQTLVSRIPLLRCWPSQGTNGPHLDLLVFSIKQETDRPGVPFPDAWRVRLSEDQGTTGSGLSAVLYVNPNGTIDEQSGPGYSNWSQLRVDGNGADLPPPVRTPNNPHHHH
jgi:hypothetical protein